MEVDVDLDEFIAEIVSALRAAGYEGAVRHDKARGVLKLPDASEIAIGPLYSDLRAAPPERRSEVLGRIAGVLLSPPTLPESWEDARDQLVLVVQKRAAQWIQDLRNGAAGKQQPEALAELTGHLVFKVAVRARGVTIPAPLERIQGWGQEPPAVFEQAARNLAEACSGEWRESPEFPGVYASAKEPGLAASRLVLPRVMATAPVKGRQVAMSPTPDLLLVTGDEDEDGLFNMARLARRMMEQDRLVHILRTVRMGEDRESWEDWSPEPGHPAFHELRLLRAIEDRTDYDAQAQVLRDVLPTDQLMALPTLEVQVSGVGAAVRTATRLGDGAMHALPKADLVVLVKGGVALGAVPWDDLASAMPGEFEPVPGVPVRYRVSGLPDDVVLDGMDLMPWDAPSE